MGIFLNRFRRGPRQVAVCLAAAVLLGLVPFPGIPGARAEVPREDRVTQSAVYLLKQSITVRRDGRHNLLLKTLRRLHDPALRPFFEHLSTSSQPSLAIHGILGLAEIAEPHQIQLAAAAQIHDPAVQARLISTAMDAKLLSDAQIAQLLTWHDLDEGAKLLLALHQLKQGQFHDATLLHQALDARRLGRKGLAALMLVQRGDPSGVKALQAIDQSRDPQRDDVRMMMLRTALRDDLEKTRMWAYAVAVEPNVDRGLRLLALRTALRLGDARAGRLWTQQFQSSDDPAQRMRLALMVLEQSPWIDPKLAQPLLADKEPLFEHIGRAAQAVAGDSPSLVGALVSLIQMNHPVANAWALQYARDQAKAGDAQMILLGLILAYEESTNRRRAASLHTAVLAAQTLYDQNPAAAGPLLRPVLANPKTKPELAQAILLGLIRADKGQPRQVLAGLAPFSNPACANLALLLEAKHPGPLSASRMHDLGLLVEGGGGLQPTLRLDAAWAWLTRTKQVKSALKQVFK